MDDMTSYVPTDIMTLDLAASAKLVLIFISTLPDGFYSTTKSLAAKLHMPVRTVSGCLAKLTDLGFIYKDKSESLRINTGKIRKEAERAREPEQTELKSVCSGAFHADANFSTKNNSCGKVVGNVVENSTSAKSAESQLGKNCRDLGKNCRALYIYTNRDLSKFISDREKIHFSKICRKVILGTVYVVYMNDEDRILGLTVDPEPEKPLSMKMILEAEKAAKMKAEDAEHTASNLHYASEAPASSELVGELFTLLTGKYERTSDEARELITRMEAFYGTPTGWRFKKGRKKEITVSCLERICKTWVSREKPKKKPRFVDKETGAPIAQKVSPVAEGFTLTAESFDKGAATYGY